MQLKCQEACCTQSYLYNLKERREELQAQSTLGNSLEGGVGGWGVRVSYAKALKFLRVCYPLCCCIKYSTEDIKRCSAVVVYRA